jgi:hypothetical protein
MIKWQAFFICNSLTKPALHFFPHSPTTTAPYPVNCTITIFNSAIESRSVTLDGARINQPDGVRLDAVFPELIDGISGLVGLEIVINSESGRVDLSTSQCIVELIQGKSPTKFNAKIVTKKNQEEQNPLLVLAKDNYIASIVAVNGTAEQSDFMLTNVTEASNRLCKIDPFTVKEFGGSSDYKDSEIQNPFNTHNSDTQGQSTEDNKQISNNTLNFRKGFDVGTYHALSSSPDIAFYAVFRDSVTNNPVSVYAL